MSEIPSLEPLASGGYRTRIRFGEERRRFRILIQDLELAKVRALVLVTMGETIGAAGLEPELGAGLLTKAGAAADDNELQKILATLAKIAGGVKVKRITEDPRSAWTVRELGEAWTNGTLAKEYPDQIRVPRGDDKNISRLARHIYPVIGSVRVSAVTLADVESVMASLTGKRPTQAKLVPLTRRTIALTLNRLLNIAVYPLKLRASSPIPKGLVPKAGKRRAMTYLYPDEDRALLGCSPIPIRERLLYGFLVREGCRVSEALGLRWSDLDLKRGAVRLDKNKTDDPRAWALTPGRSSGAGDLRRRAR